jgi:hypothetical protein
MIVGKKTEANYRANMLDSSSSLKEFSMDRKKYYRRYILGEKVNDKEDVNQAAIMGRIVETLLLEPDEFDGRFYMSSIITTPTGLMLEFVESLYKYSIECLDEEGKLTRSFEDISKEAYNDAGYKIAYEAVIKKFVGSDAEIYFREICQIRPKNLTVITAQDVTFAERIVESLQNNFVTKEIVNKIDSDKWTILNQLQIEGYEVDGMIFKSMIDKLIINHDEKTIDIYDLKCTWSVENFLEDYYLYRRSYIQAYLYFKACCFLVENEESPYYGYCVKNPTFMVCDSTNYMNPLLYTLSESDMEKAYNGFERKGRSYPGVKDIIQDLTWALENNTWNISRKNFMSNGLIIIDDL